MEVRCDLTQHLGPDLLPEQAPAGDERDEVLQLLLQVNRAGWSPSRKVFLMQ